MLRLFTNVPLDKTIETILLKVYLEKKIKTSIPKSILKELLLFCPKHIHFSFNDEIYTIISQHFYDIIRRKVLPKVSNYLCYLKHYVEYTYAYVVPEKIDFILKELSSYHLNTKFTYELEEYNKITCFDVLINRIRNLITGAKDTSSTEDLLNDEIEHFKTAFCNINDFPMNAVNNIIQEELLKPLKQQDVSSDFHENCMNLQLILPYARKQGTQLTSKMKKQLKKALPHNVKTIVTYQSKKLASKFPVKDKIDL